MRIAQVAPLTERVPPARYGGTERVVSYLTEELVRLGHDVTLFASGDSQTSARLVPAWPSSLRAHPAVREPLAPHVSMLELLALRAREFDVVHFHIDYLHFPLARHLDAPHITTRHGRLDLEELAVLHDIFQEIPLVSISDAQRSPLGERGWVATVHHGLPPDLYRCEESPRPYLAFLGRVSPEKGLDDAIEIARRSGLPLKVAAKVDAADREYFEREIRSLLCQPGVEFIGEIADDEKQRFLGEATALLFPIRWPEPFGLVMVEAMACGTPVVAYRQGSVPEIIEHGVTGYIVDGIEEAVEAVQCIPALSRRQCREVFDARFSACRMAEDYVRVYEQVIEQAGLPGGGQGPAPGHARRPLAGNVDRASRASLRPLQSGKTGTDVRRDPSVAPFPPEPMV